MKHPEIEPSAVEITGNGLHKTERVNLGLAILHALTPRGQTHTANDIAAWCDCSHQNIKQIEERALKKLRRRLGPEWARELVAVGSKWSLP
jgi:DNA-directed RNA polymerase sigma subunit (sigma70/sigma32)